MSPSGVVLMVAGVWVLAQVFAGNALGRLNIVTAPDPIQGYIRDLPGSSSSGSTGSTGSDAPVRIPGGLPNIDYGSLINRAGG